MTTLPRRRITLEVLGNPKAQKRHRQGKFGTYDPDSEAKKGFLTTVQSMAPKAPITGPVELIIYFRFPRPKHHYGTGKKSSVLKENAPDMHTSKPDVDNLIKFVTDALNGIYWKDDSQVTQVTAAKFYSDKPRTEITIYYNEK